MEEIISLKSKEKLDYLAIIIDSFPRNIYDNYNSYINVQVNNNFAIFMQHSQFSLSIFKGRGII